MQYIKRAIFDNFLKQLTANKVLVLFGPRRVGKTVFIKQIAEAVDEPFLLLSGEDSDTVELLLKRSIQNYRGLLHEKKLLVIDEAQKIPQIGEVLKLIVDHVEGIKVIATGSSTFDLDNKLGEPLTGRKITFNLFPLSQMELSNTETIIQTKANLEDKMIFGNYPELLQYTSREQKTQYLKEIVNSYLLKDILAFEGIRNSSKLMQLLRLVAFQIGNEVSYNELGRQLQMSRNTVERYMDLLSKVFIIYRVDGYSRNLRKEITKNSKWYFFDNGIRNTIIANHNVLNLRNDTGELWENYVLAERLKCQNYKNVLVNNFFWRTYQQQELDWIEEREGNLFAYELKWSAKKNVRAPKTFTTAYPDAIYTLITPENYLDWIC